ncbi:MAG: pyridoxamine 5'-phosphate oxidase family protein [Algicola sp.]|nr:pyridoxamine 5'-phosphate oxidase family protein [Algicola sp.]
MGHKFADITFTDEVKNIQSEQGSRNNYGRWEDKEDFNHVLSQREADFLGERDSFYMASVNAAGWPYVQHRGGPAGFLKVLDEKTIGFADFRGNRQYVSTGNFASNDRVSLILMDYANRRRLKLLGRVRVVSPDDIETLNRLELGNSLEPENSLERGKTSAVVERGFLIHVEAFDWNCPQHITRRFTEAQVEQMMSALVEENRILKAAACVEKK